MFLLSILIHSVSSTFYTPDQVHIAWTDNETSMSVTWASEVPSYGASVEYSPISSHSQIVHSFQFASLGLWSTFPNMQESRILQRHLNVCKAYMINLQPGSLYAYRVGSNTYGWSNQYSFQAKRDFNDNPIVRFLVYGDLGVGDQIEATVNRLIQETNTYEYDGVIHNGDIAYDLDDDQGQRGDIFLRSIEPIAKSIALYGFTRKS